MTTYLIKSTACLLLLLLVYHVFLERETMHRFNRYFLIFSLAFGLTVPLLTLNLDGPVKLFDQINEINSRLGRNDIAISEHPPAVSPDPAPASTPTAEISNTDYSGLFWTIYLIGALIVLARFLRNLYTPYTKISENPRTSWKSVTLVLTDDGSKPHSFFNYIFVDRQLYQSGAISPAILTHERTHARQKHSLDILLIELLKIAFWFNPVLYFYKRAMQTNHEFLADASVIQENESVKNYQHLLLKMKSPTRHLPLASNITFSLTKKRIMMMTKNSTRWIMTGKKLALIPVLAVLIFAFSTRTTVAQTVQQMSLTELINAVSERMNAVDSLTDEEQQQLRSLISKMQQKLQLEAPPPPMPKNPDPEKALNAMEEAYKEHVAYYNDIKPVESNLQELKKIYERARRLYHNIDQLQHKVYDNPLPLPPMPLSPAERIQNNPNNSSPPPTPIQSPDEISQRNLLPILINPKGLILIDDKPIPLSDLKAEVKAFITNYGSNPNLSVSPQKAIVFVKIAGETIMGAYMDVIEEIREAHHEVRNEVAQAEYGMNFDQLEKGSSAKNRIKNMYPGKISVEYPNISPQNL